MTALIAITGATGFAGRHVIDALLAEGHRLRALVRNPQTASLPGAVELVPGDLADRAALARLVAGTDAAVHLAGAIAAPTRQDYFTANAEGTRALIEAARAVALPRFIHISSLAAREPQLSAYAASKRAGEEMVRADMAALNAIVIRPPAVYGPGDRGTLPLIRELTRPVAAIPAPPDARFSLIHARDLARLIRDAVLSDVQGLHEVSDGTPRGHGWADLVAAASALRGGPVRPLFLPRALPATVAAAAEAVAWFSGKAGLVNRGKIAELYHPDWVSRAGCLALADPIPFSRGLADTVQWYRSAGWLPPARRTDRTAPSSGTLR